MRLTISLEQRYDRTPDGNAWTSAQYPYDFWTQYLDVFDELRILARVRDVAAVPEQYKRVDGEHVGVCALPHYLGPLEYLKKRAQLLKAVREAAPLNGAFLLRASSQIGNIVHPILQSGRYPYGVEVVSDPSDAFAPGVVKHPLSPVFRTLFTRRLRRLCAEAAAVAYVTQEHLQRRYPCPSYSCAVSDVQLPDDAVADAPRSFREFKGEIRLVFVGSLAQPYKGADVLVEAAGRCVRDGLDIRLIIIGDGRCRPWIERLVREAGLGERAIFTGQLCGPETVRAYLDRADLFVLPSRTEGLPRAAIEAMARALPCICSEVGGIPELLPKEDLVPAGDSASLAAKIKEVVTDSARLRSMSARNLEVSRRYRTKLMQERKREFLKYLRDITGERSRRNSPMACVPPEPESHEAPGDPQFSPKKCRRVLQLATQSATAYRFAMPLAKHLRSKGYEVCLGCSGEPQDDVASFHDEIRFEGFDVESLPIPRAVRPIADLRALVLLVRFLRNRKFDIVHTHNSKAGMIGRVAARLADVPFVVHTNHGLPFFKANKFSLAQSLLFWALEAAAARITDRLLAVSSAEFIKAERFKIARPPRLVNVGQGLRTDYYSVSAVSGLQESARIVELRQRLQGKLVLGSVGRLVSEKGISTLIEAVGLCAAEHPNLIVAVAGDGPQRPSLEEQVRNLDLEPRVIFLGQVADQDDLRKLYTLMDIFVLPTRWESFGMVFAEAMAMEVPVIGTNIEPVATVVKDGETGLLIPPDDSRALADAIRGLASDPGRRREMGWAGRKRVLDLWDERMMLAQVERVYGDLEGAKPSGGIRRAS